MKKFLIGALMGACAALLYAPRAGAETRSQLRDKANKIGHDIEDLAQSKGKHLANKVQGYKHKMQHMADNLRGQAEKEMAGVGIEQPLIERRIRMNKENRGPSSQRKALFNVIL